MSEHQQADRPAMARSDQAEPRARAAAQLAEAPSVRALGATAQLINARTALRPHGLGSGGSAVLQPFWELTRDGKVEWVNGAAPPNYQNTGRTKKNAPVFAHPEVLEAERQRQAQEAAERLEALRGPTRAAAIAPRSRSRFSRPERARLNALPTLLTREDDDFHDTHGRTRRRKAHLVDSGLETAGPADISATEQMDQDSNRKERGNRISSKQPLGRHQKDASQNYGGQTLGIKARKLERARLRGKEDAQHVRVHTPDDIQTELDRGPATSDSGKTRETLKIFARKDREYHHSVGFPLHDTQRAIPNRFLVLPDGTEEHDSDSDSDSDEEREPVVSSSRPPPVSAASSSAPPPKPKKGPPGFWDEDYGMTSHVRSRRDESDDMDPDLYS